MSRLVWMDGRIVEEDFFRIDPADERFLYGIGLFETTRTWKDEPWLWDEHLDRLRYSAAQLDLSLEGACLPTAEVIASFVRELGEEDIVVRLNVFPKRRSLAARSWMITRPLPAIKNALVLDISPIRISSTDPLARHKTFNYGVRHLARRKALEEGFDGAILVDEAGHVLEASHANLFLWLNGEWVTPPLSKAVLPGVVRQTLLNKKCPVPIREDSIALSQLDRCESAFLSNSVIGVVPVERMKDRSLFLHDDVDRILGWLRESSILSH